MSLTTYVYQLLHQGVRDGWLCLDDLDPNLAGIQVWLALPDPCPLHDDPAAPCHNVAVREVYAAGTLTRYRPCHLDGSEPPPDAGEVTAVRLLWADGTAGVLGPAHAPYFHRVVARHRPGQ